MVRVPRGESSDVGPVQLAGAMAAAELLGFASFELCRSLQDGGKTPLTANSQLPVGVEVMSFSVKRSPRILVD